MLMKFSLAATTPYTPLNCSRVIAFGFNRVSFTLQVYRITFLYKNFSLYTTTGSNTHTHTYIHTQAHAFIHTYIHTHLHKYTHMYTFYTDTHICTHTRAH